MVVNFDNFYIIKGSTYFTPMATSDIKIYGLHIANSSVLHSSISNSLYHSS